MLALHRWFYVLFNSGCIIAYLLMHVKSFHVKIQDDWLYYDDVTHSLYLSLLSSTLMASNLKQVTAQALGKRYCLMCCVQVVNRFTIRCLWKLAPCMGILCDNENGRFMSNRNSVACYACSLLTVLLLH